MNEQCAPIQLANEPINQTLREVKISTLNYGYLVNIDCHSFAIETKAKLIEKLSAYFNNPSLVEEEWFAKKTL